MSFLLAAVSSALMVASYPDLGWWPLVFCALWPLLVALQGASWRRRLLLGWLTGSLFIAGKHFWIATTMVNLSGLSWPLAILCLVLYALFVGGQWAVFAWAYGFLRAWSGRYSWVVTAPLLYAVCELWWPSVFQLYAGYALWEVPVLLQTAEWIGPSGITWLVVLSSCTLAHVSEEYARGRTSDLLVPTAVAALWLVVSVWGVVRMKQVWQAPVKGHATVALVQANVTVAEKRADDVAVRMGVYDRTEAMTRDALARRPDLVVWPEGGFPYVYQSGADTDPKTLPGVYSRKLRRLALEIGVPMVVGSLRTAEGTTRNSALFFDPGGGEPTPYDKRELLILGERVPFADTWPGLVDVVPGLSHFEPGAFHLDARVAGLWWTVGICYEAVLPHATRHALDAAHGGDVLLNLTNDVWFGPRAEPRQHLMAQVMRTIESRLWLVRSTNSGISAFVDPTGTIRARTEVGRQTTLFHEIGVPKLKPTVYRRHGDLILWLAVALTILWLLWQNQTRFRNFRRRPGVSEGAAR